MHRGTGYIQVAIADRVAYTKLDRIDVQFAGDQVDVAFGCPDTLELTRRAHDATGHVVGVNGTRLHAHLGHQIRRHALKNAARQHAHTNLRGRVRPAVEDDIHR